MLRTNEKNMQYSLICVFGLCVLICEANQSTSKAKVTEITNFKPMTTTAASIKLTAANAVKVDESKDGLQKRNIKFKDLSENTVASAKSYDPPPEYYRGHPSTISKKSATTNNYSNREGAASDFIAKPVTFPDAAGRRKYGDAAAEYTAGKSLRESTQGYGNGQDRISVGHYGSPDHSTSHGETASSFIHGIGISTGYGGHGGYDVTRRPYDSYHNAYNGGATQYPVATHGHGGTESHYYDSNESGSIPFDVYGSKGHYAGGGGEYSYTTYPASHEPVTHKGHGIDWQHKTLLAKSFLIPLASAAVLGIAAALVSNPLLLQLGTVSGPTLVGKRRKRRDLSLSRRKTELAYRAHQERRLTCA